MSSLDNRPWYAEPAVLPADCPEPGCPYSVNACPGHVEQHAHQPTEEADEACSYCGRYRDDTEVHGEWCDECQDWTPTREGPLVRVICDECGTDREPE